jgi:putative peptidoglycan lipid II flippase
MACHSDGIMKQNLFKSTFVFSFMTVISRITGLFREIAFAYYFGASAGMDAFNIAYRIPNFFRGLLGEGAFSQAFIPILSEYKERENEEKIKVFLNHLAGLMILILFILTAIAVIIAPYLVYVVAPGYINDPGRFNLTTAMLRITFPYILFISLTAYVSGVLNAYGKFGVPAFTPNLLNLVLIVAAIFLSPYFAEPTMALAWGIFIGGAAQLIFQLPFIAKLNFLPRPSISLGDNGVIRVLKLMLPAMFGVSIAQISFLVDNWLASFLQVGSVSWFNYSSRLALFPLGVFGVAIATVVLPYLSRQHAANSEEEFSRALDWAIKFILLIALPAVIGLLILAGPIITTLFHFKTGRFTEFDIYMVRRSLWGFTLGIPAFMLVKVLASGFYSRQNIKTPVKIAVRAMLANMVLAAILVWPLKHAGLALATSLTATLNASLLFWNIVREKHYTPGNGWGTFLIRLLCANSILALFLWFMSDDLTVWFGWSSFSRIWHLTFLCGGSVLIYFSTLWLSGMKLRELIFKEAEKNTR